MASVPSVDEAFLEGRGGGEAPGVLGKRVTRLTTGVLGGLGPVAASVEHRGLQEGLRPVRAVVQAAVKRVRET